MTNMTKTPFNLEDNLDVGIAEGVGVLKKDDFLTLLSAETLMQEAQKTLQEAREEAERLLASEKQRGYDIGYQEAMKEKVAKSCEDHFNYQKALKSVELKMIGIIGHVTKKVLGSIPQNDLIEGLTKSALAEMRDQTRLVLRVNPVHREFLIERLEEIRGEHHDIGSIDVVGEKELSETSCVLENFAGVIVDASLDIQIAGLEQALAQLGIIKHEEDQNV